MTHIWVKLNNGKSFPYNYRKQNLYDYHEVDSLIAKLNDKGYKCIQTYEGSLGSGNWICIAPDDKHYNFIIKEVGLNAWSSAHTVNRRRKLTKADLAELAAYEREVSMT